MRGARLREAEAVFHAVVDLPPTQRAAAVATRCGDDEELRAFVEQLLASHESEGAGLLRTPVYGPRDAIGGVRSADAPEYIGRYRIIELIGEGGMGAVYLAEQTEPLRRQVALKLVKRGMDTRQVIARFEAERQVLALMNHPNIARVFDAGVAEDGRPFFVMEYVPGAVITDHCNTRRLTTRQRLELFLQVCDAVQHAHQKGVIHRDLKPGNIVVDEQGRPRILDFGVARLTNSDVQTVTMHTAVGQLIGTVPFMSPEQVTGVPSEIDTRSDVYALGVICFRLLSGRLPHDVQRCSIPDALRIIREEEPTRLSSLDTVFRGDLDTILIKALEKDKERRYQSASELAADIRNYLANRPIAARPPTAFYQLRMFTRRNKALVGGVLATFLTLLVGILGVAIQASRVAGERDLARHAEQLADKRAYAANIAAAQAAISADDVATARQRLAAAAPNLRNWEWRYLSSRLDSSLATFRAHQHHVWSVDYGPDGSWLVSGSIDGTVKLWDVATGQVLRTMDVGERVRGVAVAPDGRSVAVATEEGSLSVWGIPDGDRWMTVSSDGGSLIDVSFSPDGTRIASASDDGAARIWKADTGEPIAVLEHPGWVQGVCFSPDSTHVATSCRDNVARVWDLATRAPVLEIPVLPATRKWTFVHSWAVAIDPSGQTLATGCHDGVIKLWNAATGEFQKSLGGHTNRVRSLSFSPDGTRLASASDDGTVRLWDPTAGVELSRLSGHEGPVFDVDFAPDGAHLASAGADHSVRIWYALGSPRLTQLRGHQNRGIWALDTSPDGKQIISVGGDRAVRLWDVESGACTAVMRGHEDWIYAVAFSPDGKLAVSGSRDATVRLWDVATREEARTLRGHHAAVWAVAFSPGGTRVASAATDGTIVLWDVATGAELLTMRSETEQLTALAFSPDGVQIATGSMVGTIEFWDVPTGRRVRVVAGHEGRIWTVAYNSAGTRLVSASSDRTLKLWDPSTGERIATLEGHAGYARAAVFSPDGTRVASVSYDRTLRLWDPETAETVLSFRAHLDWPCSVAFSRDGDWLVSAGASIRLWETTRPSARTMERRWARVTAEELVERLSAECPEPDDVLAQVEQDPELTESVRDMARQIVKVRER